jgi:CheY-like chemotaxis protein
LINESLSFLKAFLPPTIKIELDINIDKGRIKGNATQINQILMNLCANAADAIGINEGCIRIILDHKDFEKEGMSLESGLKPSSYVRISVSDSGPGIKQDIINKIFDPFFSTKDPSKGSGMGLSVVRRIVYDHGGTITVDNKPGKGATFHVYFPQSDGLTEAEPRLSDFLPGGNERILVVDDEALMVQSIQALLQRIGYEVTGVTSGRDALNIFRARPDAADLVITDQTMPDLTGIEMAKELSRIRPDIPLILMTGFSETLSSEVSEDRGIDAFLMKPVNSSEMATTVRRVLDRKK